MPPRRITFAEQMQAVLDGAAAYDDLPGYLQSAIQLPIYHLAVDILALPTKEARRARLEAVPESIRPHVESWARKIFAYRRKNA